MTYYTQFIPSLSTSIVLLAVLAVVCYLYDQLGLGRHKNAPPLDRGMIPFVGRFYEYNRDPLAYILEKRKEHGDVFSVRCGGVETVHVLDNSFLPKFFKAPESEASIFKNLQWRGTMLALIGEEIPHSHAEVDFIHSLIGVSRRRWFPLVAHMAADFEAVFLEFLDELKLPAGGVITSKEWMGEMIWRMTIRAVLGADLQANAEFIALIRELPDLVYACEHTMGPGWPLMYLRCKQFHKRFNALVLPSATKRRRWQVENPDGWLKEHGLTDLMSACMDQNPPNSVEHVSERTMLMRFMSSAASILFAAVTNSVNAFEGTMLSILNDPDVHRSLAAEIDAACGRHGGAITAVPTAELGLLSSCLREYLRMYPPILAARGVVNKPMELPNGYVAPCGTIIAVSGAVAMRDPARFPRPMRFDPARLLEPAQQRHERDLVFMPFGHGKHKCLGVTMVQQEIKIAIGNLVRLYELELLDPMPAIKYEAAQAVGVPQKSVRIKLTRRKHPLGSHTQAAH